MRTRRERILRGLLAGVGALFLLILAVAWWLLDGSRARLDGQHMLPGLVAPVQVSRDANGTVTIEGKSRSDISYALGFVHAQERFFEMDLMRRMPAGELAALAGPAALKLDLNHRRHRLRSVVEAAYATLPEEEKKSSTAIVTASTPGSPTCAYDRGSISCSGSSRSLGGPKTVRW